MFDGTLGKYTGSDYTIELKEDAKPYHAKPIAPWHLNKFNFFIIYVHFHCFFFSCIHSYSEILAYVH